MRYGTLSTTTISITTTYHHHHHQKPPPLSLCQMATATPPAPKPKPRQMMLLTKRLTYFLAQNTSPALPTLLLLSPTGKLLSSSSPSPASTLRTQATLACSLWTLYQPTADLLPQTLPSSANAPSQGRGGRPGKERGRGRSSDRSRTADGEGAGDEELSTVTIQLSNGIMVISALSCGLLFVAIGPSPAGSTATATTTATTTAPGSPNPAHAPLGLHAPALSRQTSPPSSPAEGEEGKEIGRLLAVAVAGGRESTVASDAGSVRSSSTARTGSGGLMGVKRQAVEVGRWLDGQLEGFRLGNAEVR